MTQLQRRLQHAFFSDIMIRAFIDRRKTQARYLVKLEGLAHCGVIKIRRVGCGWTCRTDRDNEYDVRCPYMVGDQIWVKEAFGYSRPSQKSIIYRADHKDVDATWNSGWRPSLQMRRRHSRISMTVADVQVERLQDMTRDQAMAVGVTEYLCDMRLLDEEALALEHLDADEVDDAWRNATSQRNFQRLWDSWPENKRKRQFVWETNPWTWVVTFNDINIEN